MPGLLQVLLLEHDAQRADQLLAGLPGALPDMTLKLERVESRDALYARIAATDPDVILASISGEGEDLRTLAEEIECQAPNVTVVGLTRDPGVDLIRQSVRLGLQDLVLCDGDAIQQLARTLLLSFERKQRLYYNDREAFRDPITGSMNRVAFIERLRYAILAARRRRERFCLASFEFQDFALIAEAFGWSACELLVRAIGQRFRDHLRATDAVARLRENHFLVLLEDISREKKPALVERLYGRLTEEPFRLELPIAGQSVSLSLTAKVGLSLYPEHVEHINLEEDVQRLMFAADIALESVMMDDLNNVITFDPLLFEQQVIGGPRPN